ncbi:MAG: GtrA family protein [Pseudomonadota bacterium]
MKIDAPLLQQLFRFACVGGVGFSTDGGILWALTSTGVDPYLARVFSFPVAVVATWWLNRQWTFASARPASMKQQIKRYFATQIVGVLSNYVVYSGYLMVAGVSPKNIAIGFFLGAVLGMFVNYFGSRLFVFRQ